LITELEAREAVKYFFRIFLMQGSQMKSMQQYLLENGLAVTTALVIILSLAKGTHNAGAIAGDVFVYDVIFLALGWLLVCELDLFKKIIGKDLTLFIVVTGTLTFVGLIISSIVTGLFKQAPLAQGYGLLGAWILALLLTIGILWLRNFKQAREILR